jgi:hypothetical protein
MKKSIFTLIANMLVVLYASAQLKVGSNPTNINSSAILDIESSNKGVLFPRVALTSSTDQTTVSSPAIGLLVYNVGTATLKPEGYYFWNGTEWRLFSNQASSASTTSGVVKLEVGEMVTWKGQMPNSASTGTVLSSLFSNLPVIDGWRIDAAKVDGVLYRPRIYNVNSPFQVISYQTFATVVNQNKTQLNKAVPFGDFIGADHDDLVYWTTTDAEVLTTNVNIQVGPSDWRWYEFQWWAMEIPNSGMKTIFLSVRRKG